jgi:hypothetical protein
MADVPGRMWKKMRAGQAFWPNIPLHVWVSKNLSERCVRGLPRLAVADSLVGFGIGCDNGIHPSVRGKRVCLMVRATTCWAVVALVAVTAGCTMCDHPYDYCGPTVSGRCGPACGAEPRAGSILSPGAIAGPEISSEQVVSVSDDVVPQPVAPGEQSQRPTARNRWTARPPQPVR